MSGVENITVSDADDDIRLDKWFKRHYPAVGFGRLSKLMRKGQVRLDGKRVKGGERVQAGQVVRVPPLSDEERKDEAPKREPRTRLTADEIQRMQNMILYEDDHVIVLNKEPGLPVQGGTNTQKHIDGMLEALMRPGDTERPKLVHRLDKDTSGVLLLARSAKTAKVLAGAFKTRETEKLYWALLKGVPKWWDGKLDNYMDKVPGPHGEKMMLVDADEGGKRAITYFRIVETANKQAAWAVFQPRTGRTHQLRLHATCLETPIVGDGKYGTAEAFLGGLISNKLHLHARTLTFPHPEGGKMTVTAPLPRHMKQSWKVLGFDEKDHANPFEEDF